MGPVSGGFWGFPMLEMYDYLEIATLSIVLGVILTDIILEWLKEFWNNF